MDNNESSFWRNNGKNVVPGRPKNYLAKSKNPNNGSSSFQDYQNSVKDAWSEECEFSILSGE
jgi:hypothetical protein